MRGFLQVVVSLAAASAFWVSPHEALADGISGDFVQRCGDQLCLGNEAFRFISFNAPELSMRENPYWDAAAAFDQEDIIGTIATFGGRVTRTYVLSIAGTGKDPVHVEAPGQYGEEAFRSLDRVLALANKHGVKVIIPFIDTWEWWGGIPQFSAMHGVSADEFYSSDVTKAAYKDLVAHTINRINSITGVPYGDDPAILAWETGNELRKAPTEWTVEMAAFIKSLDSNHLVIDGNDEHHDARVLDDPNVDIIARHYYGSDFAERFTSDVAWARGKRPILVEEYGLASVEEIRALVDAIVSSGTTGGLIWSLRNHDSLGGWHWHCESGGTCAYHWPGFAAGEGFHEIEVLGLLHEAAWAVRGEPVPPTSAPATPQLLPISTPLDIQWRGTVGAAGYDIERSLDDGQSWVLIGSNVPDSVSSHDRRVLRTVTDLQSGRVHEAALSHVLFQDSGVAAGDEAVYRIRALNAGGASAWSSSENVLVAIDDGVRFVDLDKLNRTVARFEENSKISRVEILTNADAFSTDAACWPQVISLGKRVEVTVVDAPEVHDAGATLVTADGALLGNDLAIAQPCRGAIQIAGLRYAFGRYELDVPRPPARELPVDVIDQFEAYGSGGLDENWKPHPSGNKTGFVVTDAGTGSPHLVVTYELGSPNYSGVQRFLPRDNWRQFEGLSFEYRGEGGAENLTIQFRADSGYWETSIGPPPEEWTSVKIPFTAFHEPPWSEQNREFASVGVTEFSLYVGGRSGGSYEIENITLY